MVLKFYFEVNGLSIDDCVVLLRKIDLIIHHIYKPLNKDLMYTLDDDFNSSIIIDSNDVSVDTAFSLFKLFKELDVGSDVLLKLEYY